MRCAPESKERSNPEKLARTASPGKVHRSDRTSSRRLCTAIICTSAQTTGSCLSTRRKPASQHFVHDSAVVDHSARRLWQRTERSTSPVKMAMYLSSKLVQGSNYSHAMQWAR